MSCRRAEGEGNGEGKSGSLRGARGGGCEKTPPGAEDACVHLSWFAPPPNKEGFFSLPCEASPFAFLASFIFLLFVSRSVSLCCFLGSPPFGRFIFLGNFLIFRVRIVNVGSPSGPPPYSVRLFRGFPVRVPPRYFTFVRWLVLRAVREKWWTWRVRLRGWENCAICGLPMRGMEFRLPYLCWPVPTRFSS